IPPPTPPFPYTTLFRSGGRHHICRASPGGEIARRGRGHGRALVGTCGRRDDSGSVGYCTMKASTRWGAIVTIGVAAATWYCATRSEERRVGKEWRGGWW